MKILRVLKSPLLSFRIFLLKKRVKRLEKMLLEIENQRIKENQIHRELIKTLCCLLDYEKKRGV